MGCGFLRARNSPRKSDRRASDALMINPGQFFTKTKGGLSSNYIQGRKLGSGAFADVYLCKYIPTNQSRAVKIIHKAGLRRQQIDPVDMLNEIKILTTLDHPNILRCYEIFEDSWKFFVAAEYCQGGELFGQILKLKVFSENKAAWIMHQLLSAVSYCHSKLVIHRDLKPENILLDDNDGELNIKVADFGSSCFLDPGKKLSGCFGSAYYVAPEVLDDEYNEKCDIWSCGVIMYILITGKPPYPGKDSKYIMHLVKTEPLTITPDKMKGVSEEAVDLLKKMLTVNPKHRISAKEAVNHPWIQNYRGQPATDLTASLESLKQFTHSAKLKDAVHIFIATQIISREEIKTLRVAFQALDLNSDGKISREELMSKYLETLNEEDAKTTVDKIIMEVDKNLSGDIDYSEFLSACMNYSKYLSKENLEAAFKLFDKDESGFITADELKEVLGKGEQMPGEAWNEILTDVDENGDGVIDLVEFVKMMTEKF